MMPHTQHKVCIMLISRRTLPVQMCVITCKRTSQAYTRSGSAAMVSLIPHLFSPSLPPFSFVVTGDCKETKNGVLPAPSLRCEEIAALCERLITPFAQCCCATLSRIQIGVKMKFGNWLLVRWSCRCCCLKLFVVVRVVVSCCCFCCCLVFSSVDVSCCLVSIVVSCCCYCCFLVRSLFSVISFYPLWCPFPLMRIFMHVAAWICVRVFCSNTCLCQWI